MKNTHRVPQLAAQLVLTCLILFSPSIVLSTRLESTTLVSRPATYQFDQQGARPTCYLNVHSFDGKPGPLVDTVVKSLSGDLRIETTNLDSYFQSCPKGGDCHLLVISFSNGQMEVGVKCRKTEPTEEPRKLLCLQRTGVDSDAAFCKVTTIRKAIALVKKHLDHDRVENATGRR